MESPSTMFDNVKFEKEKAIARFNRVRRVMKLWQILRVATVLAAVSWLSARSPAVARSTGLCLFDVSACLFNHHVVFLIGNAIIALLFMLCRQGDGGGGAPAGSRDFHDDYAKYSEAARALPSPQQGEKAAHPPAEFGGGDDCDKQIVAVRADEATTASPQCDDVAVVIEKAARQIRKFQRNNSEMLRRDIAVRPELRRSETEHRRQTTSPESADIENLSSEEFRRRVDAFIDKHWIKRTAQLEGNESFESKLREY